MSLSLKLVIWMKKTRTIGKIVMEFKATPPDWATFKEALFREYPQARKPFISSADLISLSTMKSKQEIHTLDEYAAFHREFRSWQHD